MCIAIGKPMGVKCPSKETLSICFKNNDDGAGFAFAYKGQVFIKKGYMTFESFYDAFDFYRKKYDFDKLGVLIHFRIATHGNRDASMTHPFPISSDDGALKKIEYHSDYAVVHNGIISLTSTGASRTTGLSDTAIFIKDYLSPISENLDWFHIPSNIELIYKLIDSKMAILNKEGEIIHTNGFTLDSGIYYSNNTYKENRYTYNPVTTPYANNWTGYSSGYSASSTPTTTASSSYVKLCRLKDNIKVITDDDQEYAPILDSEEEECICAYFIDSDNTFYIGYLDNGCAYFDELYEDYLWQFSKIGKVKQLMINSNPVNIGFVCNTVCYPDQIVE